MSIFSTQHRTVYSRGAIKRSKFLKLCNLLLAAFPTIVFGIFTVVFTLQQDVSSKAVREQDQRQADEINRRTLFKEYIDDMTTLLMNDNDTDINKRFLHMRVQTLTVLQNLDANRKRDVIVFLYENRLLRSDESLAIDLHGASLNGIQFSSSSTVSCRLPFLYLPGTYLENAIFHGCQLRNAVFDDASMIAAKFLICSMPSTSFVNTNLTGARLQGNYLSDANFSGSYLGQSLITGGVFQRIELTNVDLYQSEINEELLHPTRQVDKRSHTFRNTRYPNGSFVYMNRQSLKMSRDAKTQCDIHSHFSRTNSSLKQISENNMTTINHNCFNLTSQNKGTIATIDIGRFSVLIDLGQAMFSLSTWIRLKNPNAQDEMSMTIEFHQDEGVKDDEQSIIISKMNISSAEFHSRKGSIPRKTRTVLLWSACEIVSSSDQFCIFDQVNLFIFEKMITD